MTVRVDRDALAAFDASAVARGGRSALVRQLIDRALREGGEAARIDLPQGRSGTRISLRFTNVETAVIDYRGSARERPGRLGEWILPSSRRSGCSRSTSRRNDRAGGGSAATGFHSRSACRARFAPGARRR